MTLKKPSRKEMDRFVEVAGIGDNAAVTMFLDKYGSQFIDKGDETGMPALLWAAANGRADTVALLFERGASLNATSKGGVTALMMAEGHGQPGIAAWLRQQLEIQRKTEEQNDWLHRAASLAESRLHMLKQSRPAASPFNKKPAIANDKA